MQARKLVALFALLAPLPLLGACGGDDTAIVSAGSAGAAGAAAGRAGAAGSTVGGAGGAAGGKAGAAGSSASAGSAGQASGGKAGQAGSSGVGGQTGGAGGQTGGAGGQTGGASGQSGGAGGQAAGAAGTAGKAGAAGSIGTAGQSGSGNPGGSGGTASAGSAGSGPASTCGDGVIDAKTEECDDGNKVDTDACTAGCRIAICGDEIVAATEGCDDGNTTAGDGCSADCKLESCGDGIKQAGEACDDGNKLDTDACSNACKLPACGDGIVQGDEQCDDGNGEIRDACAACKNASCGDGIVQTGVEICDDGNLLDTDGCTSLCKPARCGDGFVQAGEICDDGNDIPGDGCFLCDVDVCGNGALDAGEECDGALLSGKTCATATGNDKLIGTLSCSPNCFFDTTKCFEGCASQSAEATLKKKPVDIIFVVDNSGSMTDEIVAVQNNINTSFAAIIGASGLDYRVILISRQGNARSGQSICIGAPLSADDCSCNATTCTNFAGAPKNTERFRHYSFEVTSTNSLQAITSRFTVADEYNLAPTGWREWARPEAFKVFVEITDDQSSITAAAFETALFALPGNQFGTAAKRNYLFHSIVGVPLKNPATTPYQPNEPKTPTSPKCSSAVNTGQQYQDLSISTGGLRFPVCNTASYDAVFQQIAQGIVEGSAVECAFPIPPDPAIDRATLRVEYTPGDGGAKQVFGVVNGVGACAPGKVYIAGDIVNLCPATCSAVQTDSKAKLSVVWGCGGINE